METVSSNGVAIPFDDDHFAPMVDSTALLDDPPGLVRRYQEDGYLLLRGVLDPAAVRAVRGAYFAAFDPAYLAEGTDAEDGVWSGARPEGMPAHGVAGHPARSFVRARPFLELCADGRLAGLAATLLGGPVEQLTRRIIRHFDRSRPAASRAHVDHTYLDRGSDRLVTAWVPLGDCPLPTGGLVYLDGSHLEDRGRLEALRRRRDRDDPRPLSHDLGFVAEALGRRWRWADYRAGDVALHSPHIVHASLDTTTDRMRLSADVRYLAAGEDRDDRWDQPWAGDDGN